MGTDAAQGWRAGLGKATSLARLLDFDRPHARAFGAPAAVSTAFAAGSFTGDVMRGGSCNCRAVQLIPHCNGTHTETAAHLTREPLSPGAVVPLEPLPALLVTVTPVRAEGSGESADPAPRPGDRLISAQALRRGWPAAWPAALPPPRVLALRTGAFDEVAVAPYLSLEAAHLIVERGIEHLVLELPSVDRGEDGGRLAGHRVMFGLPSGSTRLADATRAFATVTELASIPASCPDGPCAIQLQLTAWTGDAVPSRPVHFALETA
jgi:kynurenine formamidase